MIRPYQPADAEAVLALNEANVPEVGTMDADKLQLFVDHSPFFRVVEVDGVVVGMLVGLTEAETVYPSPNYRWFCQRNEAFAYIDRVAVAESARGQGWGPALYKEFEAWARSQGKPLLCAEVNTIPANPRSLRFHEIYGFVEVGRERPYGPDEEVAMLEFALSSEGSAGS